MPELTDQKLTLFYFMFAEEVWRQHYLRDFSTTHQSPMHIAEELSWKNKYRIKLLATLMIKWTIDEPMNTHLPKWNENKIPVKMAGVYGMLQQLVRRNSGLTTILELLSSQVYLHQYLFHGMIHSTRVVI